MLNNLKNQFAFTVVLCLMLYCPLCLFAQNIEWQKCIGGNTGEIFYTSAVTADGGAIFVGSSSSEDGDLTNVPQDHGNGVWFVKMSADQRIEWQKRFGTSHDDTASSVLQTDDGGYLVLGYFHSSTLVASCNSDSDIWLAKLSATGTIEWSKCFVGSNASKLIKTLDGGYAILGNTTSTVIDGNHGGQDGWLIKLSSGFNIEWQKYLGGSGTDYLQSVVQTTDGGYIVTGETNSSNGDVSNYHNGTDAWVVKMSSTGNVEWKKCLGGSKDDHAVAIVQTSDGNYVLAGSTLSNDGDVVGQHGQGQDIWVIKLSVSGVILWQKCLGGDGWEQANDMMQTKDGAFVIAGWADSKNGDVTQLRGTYDGWVVKVSATGTLVWQKTIGGVSRTAGFSSSVGFNNIIRTPDNGCLVSGYAFSDDSLLCSRLSQTGFIAKLSTGSTVVTKSIAGHIERTNTTCQPLSPPQYNAHTTLKIEKNNATYYTSSDSVGHFGIVADTGRFNLTAIAPNRLWTSCGTQTVAVQNPNIQDTTIVNPRLYINTVCPLMEVELTTPYLVRCFPSQYYIHYANRGTAIKNNALLELTLDSLLTFISASRPLSTRTGNTITFALGNVGIGEEGLIIVNVLVDCNSENFGYIHCSSAVIPNTLPCEISFDTLPTITTPCIASCQDSVAFVVTKPTSGQNTLFKYQLIADFFVIDTGHLNLKMPSVVKHKQDNRTYRLEIRDEQNQLLAARFIQNNSRLVRQPNGIGRQFIEGLKRSNRAENCTINRGGFDPNDKSALPIGVGDNHLVEQGTMLDYLVQFQNTGTFTAFNVVVKDTLPSYFDLSSIKITATSHPVTWQLDPKGILTIGFKNINLIDSFTNEKKSHGFFRYQLRLKDSIAIGTRLQNRAAIYFDFNTPVITNFAEHTIGKELVKNCLAKPSLNITAVGCPTKNITFLASPKSSGLTPSYKWFRNNDTTPLSRNAFFTLNNATNGTKIYCKVTVSSEVCTETPTVISDTFNISCINTATSDLPTIEKFDIYPNPNKGMFDVNINLEKPLNIHLSVLNLLGQTILTDNQYTHNFSSRYNLSLVPSGVYFVKIVVDGHLLTKKLIIEK